MPMRQQSSYVLKSIFKKLIADHTTVMTLYNSQFYGLWWTGDGVVMKEDPQWKYLANSQVYRLDQPWPVPRECYCICKHVLKKPTATAVDSELAGLVNRLPSSLIDGTKQNVILDKHIWPANCKLDKFTWNYRMTDKSNSFDAFS